METSQLPLDAPPAPAERARPGRPAARPAARPDRAGAARGPGRGIGRAAPYLVIAAAVLVANALYLTGVFHPDPVYQVTGLGSAPPSSLLPGLDTIDPNSGFTAEALGHLAASDWLHGHVPWWNPFEGLGSPLAGEMQSAALFPLVLLYALQGGQVLFHLALELIAGFSTFLLLSRLVRSRAAATAGAVAFALNGTFAWLGNAAVNPVAFLPLLLLGVEQCLDRERRGLAGWPTVGLALALSVYAGFPEMAFIDGLFALVWFAVRASELVPADLVVLLKRGAAGAGTGLLLCAPVLVAFLTYLPHADLGRHAAGYGGSSQPAGLALPALVMPYVFGPIFGGFAAHPTAALSRFWAYGGGYLGAAVVALAALALPGRTERRLKVTLAVWVALGVARSVGVPGVRQAVDAIPGVGNTIFYRYAFPSWSLALIVLAAMAVDGAAGRRRRLPAAAVGVGGMVVLGALAAPAVAALGRSRYIAHPALWSALSAAAALAVLGAVALGVSRGSAGLLAAVVVAESVGLFVVPQMSAPRHVALDTGPVRYLQAHLGTGRFYTLGPVAPDYGSYWRIASLAVSDNPVPRTFAGFVTSRLDGNVSPVTFTGTARLRPSGPTPLQEFAAHIDGYRAAGVEYLLTYSFMAVPADLHLPVVYRDPQVTIRAVPGAAPLYSVTGACQLTGTDPETALCRGPGTLIRREQQMPGWTATDNGLAVPVSTWRTVFQSVPLHRGLNQVDFSFAPPHAGLGVAAALAGLAVVGLAAAFDPARRRRW